MSAPALEEQIAWLRDGYAANNEMRLAVVASLTRLVELEAPHEIVRVPYPGTEGAPTDSPHDMSHMVQIETLIAELQSIRERFGNTCVYVRRGGLSWGGVALNRRDDDQKFGLFDLQAQHDRDMRRRAEQVERLIADKMEAYKAREALEKTLRLIMAQCGIPDALDACRVIIATCERALTPEGR